MKILFKDRHSHTMELDGSLTIEELIKMGINNIRLFERTDVKDLPEGWWINVEPLETK